MKKSIISINFLLLLTIGIIIINGSCKKPDNSTAVSTGILYFHIHTDIDTTEVDSFYVGNTNTTVGIDSLGRHYYFTLAHFYLSNIVLHGINGTGDYAVPNLYILKNVATEPYLIGNVPAGNYGYVSFNVGIDAAHNHLTPPVFSASNPLSLQTPSMWFGSTTEGYVFINVNGAADTTKAQNALPANYAPFSYLIGTDSMLHKVTMPSEPFTVAANSTQFVHLVANYAKLFRHIDFKTQNKATPGYNRATDLTIANAIPGMFRYEY